MQYAISILVGAVLGAGLFFLLLPPSQPPSIAMVSSEAPDTESDGPFTPAAEDLGSAPPAVLTTPAPQARQERTGPGQQGRGVHPVRRVDPPRPLALPTPAIPLRTSALSPPIDRTEKSVVETPPASVPTRLEPAIVQVPTPPPTEQGPQFMVQVGPVADRDRAAEIVNHLALVGFAAAMLATEDSVPAHFVVISDTVPLAVAERRLIALTQLNFRPQLRTLASGYAQLRFGAFASQEEADRLARAVRITGFAFAAVVREGGTVYVVTLGPHRPEAVETIQRALRSRFRAMLPVTVTPTN